MRRLALIALAFAPLACQPAGPPAPPHTPATAAARDENLSADAAKVELKETTPAAFDAAVAAQKGKVVLVDIWFLGCDPCKKKFPSVVALHEKYAGKGLVVMSLDMMPSDVPVKDKVLAFLTRQKAAFPNYVFSEDDAALDAWKERAAFKVTPAVILVDRQGNRLKTLEEPTAEAVEAAVVRLLAAK